MNILLTGATGFLGQHVVPLLIARKHDVTILSRNPRKVQTFSWADKVSIVKGDWYNEPFEVKRLARFPDMLVHLAWHGLPNYNALYHFEMNMPADYRFLKSLVSAGLKHVLVTGTCYEYGMQNGELHETTPTIPSNAYGLAKDSLRKQLEMLRNEFSFSLKWLRLFYIYGQGQHEKSLFSQLEQAIKAGAKVFNMSSGEQLRDYLPVENIADTIASLLPHDEFNGIINCCSGKPISIRNLVERYLAERGLKLRLNMGHYPVPAHEPIAFWGSRDKLDQIIGPLHEATDH